MNPIHLFPKKQVQLYQYRPTIPYPQPPQLAPHLVPLAPSRVVVIGSGRKKWTIRLIKVSPTRLMHPMIHNQVPILTHSLGLLVAVQLPDPWQRQLMVHRFLEVSITVMVIVQPVPQDQIPDQVSSH